MLLALVLLKCATADVRRRNRSPLSLPRRHALQLRGGTATATPRQPAPHPPRQSTSVKKKHAYITPRELTQIMVADLAPHGMLPLAWAATRGAGTGVVPAVLLLAVFASSSAYTLYLAAQLAEAGREARRAAPALSELWRGAKLPFQRPWTPWSRCYVAGVACFMRPLLRTCSTLWRSAWD